MGQTNTKKKKSKAIEKEDSGKKGKKKKKKIAGLDNLNPELTIQIRQVIPKVDGSLRMTEKNMTDDELQKFYTVNNISQFIKVSRPEGSKKSLKLNFKNQILSPHSDDYIEDEDPNSTVYKISYIQLSKKSFLNNINNTLRYINYFIQYFDSDETLIYAYVHMMFDIMHSSKNVIDTKSLIGLDDKQKTQARREIIIRLVENFETNITAALRNPSIIKDIGKLVEYNIDETMVKKTSNRVYDESIQMTIEHLKAITAVGVIHKFAIPLVNHFYVMNKRFITEIGMTERQLYSRIFRSFVDAFDKMFDVQMYNKIYLCATAKISKTVNKDKAMWARRKRIGVTEVIFANTMLDDYLIDISQKVLFHRSGINYINVCFDHAVRNELLQKDKHDYVDIPMVTNNSDENMTTFDMFASSKAFYSERDRIQAIVGIEDVINSLGKKYGLNFSEIRKRGEKIEEYFDAVRNGEELDPPYSKGIMKEWEEYKYYRDTMPRPLADAQMYIIMLYCSEKLHSAANTDMIRFHDLICMIMIINRDFTSRNFIYLQYFITGTLNTTHASRIIKKSIENLFVGHGCYSDWEEQFKDTLSILNMDKIYEVLKVIVATPVTIHHFHMRDEEGSTMHPSEIGVDEFLRFLIQL